MAHLKAIQLAPRPLLAVRFTLSSLKLGADEIADDE